MGIPSSLSLQQKAEALLRTFSEQEKTQTVFPHLPKDCFVKALWQHLHAPSTIQQGRNGTCGAATLLKHLVEVRPDLYVEAAIALYKKGSYERQQLRLVVTEAMKGGTEKELQQAGINAVDAILQGAVTNAANVLLAYNPFRDRAGVRSFMWPFFARRWAKRFLETSVVATRLFPSVDTLARIDYERHFVVAIVCKAASDTLRVGFFPNHYVQILGVSGRRLRCWTWGEAAASEVLLSSFPRFVFEVLLLPR